jgi:hypothetical protein
VGDYADDRSLEEFKVRGDEVLSKIKELIREGNVRRVSIRNAQGETLLEVPLTVGVVGALLVPTLAALGAVAALVTDCTISVERADDADADSNPEVDEAGEADGG